MEYISLIGRNWKAQLGALVGSATGDLFISSPYITAVGCDTIRTNLTDALRASGRLAILTDLSPMAMCQASTDPGALHALMHEQTRTCVYHLPKLHAKVYIADARIAIVTSGNLTAGGLIENHEYGVGISEIEVVNLIRDDLTGYAALSAPVSETQLADYSRIAQ